LISSCSWRGSRLRDQGRRLHRDRRCLEKGLWRDRLPALKHPTAATRDARSDIRRILPRRHPGVLRRGSGRTRSSRC
jgi:hypothetical protein